MTEERRDIAELMPSVAKALLGDPTSTARRGTEWRYGRKGSLSVDVAHGRWYDHEAAEGGGVLDLIRRQQKCSVSGALKWLENIGSYVPPVRPVNNERASQSLRDTALRIFRDCIPLNGTIAEKYLHTRGLHTDCPDIRFHERCPFGKDERGNQVYHPAMVALVRTPWDRVPLGIHRTALTPDGRKLDRKMLGPCHGGAVLLSDIAPDSRIGICEGIETGLAVIAAGGGPVWALLSAGAMASFPVLGGIPNLFIFADNDPAGLGAAQKCAQRWIGFGVNVVIRTQENSGADYADALAAYKKEGVA